MKQLYTSLALLLVLAGVGGWIYFQERGPIAARGSTGLLRLEPEKISNLSIQTRAGERLEFARQNGNWNVRRTGVKMLGVPADDESAQSLLNALQLVQSGAIIGENASPAELAAYGLDQPRSSLSVGGAKIEFGDKPQFDVTKFYARVSGAGETASQIALLPSGLGDFTFKSLDDWRDKSILALDEKEIQTLTLKSPAVNATFAHDTESLLGNSGAWKLSSPVKGLADAAMLGLFLQQLPQTKTTKFLEESPRNAAVWGLDKPVATLELVTSKGRSTLRVGKAVAGGYAAQNSSSPAVFVMPAPLLGIMSRPLLNWRDKSVLKLNTGRLKNMKVLARGGQMNFDQTSGKWLREDGKNENKFTVAALEIGFVLQKLEAVSFIDGPQNLSTYGLDKPILELRLTSDEWSGERTVQFGRKAKLKKGNVYARVLGQSDFSPVILVLPPEALDGFEVSQNVIFGMKKK